MLSPQDDDDDSHLCIKCNATIIGLDNYVKHRKQACGKRKNETKSELPSIDPLEPTYSLGADVFFQSLELQSSVKKSSLSRLTPPTTISKTSLANIEKKGASTVSSTSHLPRMSPIETNLRGEDWIGGHSLRIGSNEDNQTKLINAVASISGSVKKDLPSTSYNIETFNDFKGDDDSEESEDSDDDDDEDEVPLGGKWKPPPNYTGGKWRPASPEREEWEEQEQLDRDYDYDAPPPGHTKGKWVPGANDKTQIMQTTIQAKGSVQYWCGPCNRRLGSRAIYDKHLMSNLHIRKVLPEHELEFSGHLEPIRNVPDKRTTRPSLFVNESVSQTPRKRQKSETKINVKIKKKKRKRMSYFIQCSGCKSRVRTHLIGKHLISHYHFRKAADNKTDIYQQFIINNMDTIVHQAPFQCSPCKFYTNWLSNFMQHWFSEEHESKVSSMDGRYWCSFCKFECDTSQDMLNHMSSSEHSEVVAVINRSMPIIIRKKTVLRCKTCQKEFRYNMEIKQHCLKTGHECAYSASDNYQELRICQHCKVKFKSSVTLAAHLKSKHKQKAFFCLLCSKTFVSSEEAKRHRQTSEHRIRRKEILSERGETTQDLSKKCPYCTEKVVLKNILELKNHIEQAHPDIRKKCPKCGKSFIFSQEVSRHTRDNACQLQKNERMSSSILWNCSQCLFTTDSQAECFFHEVLHTEPVAEAKDEKNKSLPKYSCPICSKIFKKTSLRHHLRQHTFERPFVCSTCGANFTRQSSLANHCKIEHGSWDRPKLTLIDAALMKIAEETLRCTKCKKTFSDSVALTHHSTTCSSEERQRRCPYENCSYIATSITQLNKHRRTHGERVKKYECPFCEFKTEQASHMKRHLLCHKGVKPYICPHCPFTCGSLENLRKHVLRSGRHPGLCLYACSTCSFQTNLATLLRSHYTTSHPDKYDAKTALEAVKRHLMKDET